MDGKLNGVAQGEVFWFITKGDKDNGMPSWAFLPEQKRWQIVTYVESLAAGKATGAASAPPAAAATGSPLKDPSPHAPFTDFRYEKPGTTRKITVSDLPQPYATKSSNNGAELVARPANAWPVAPAGFKVELYASGLENPRWLRTAPNGDIFLAESEPGRIRVFRGMTSDGKPEQMQIFASGLKQPYGIAFYPPGPDPQWIYIGNTNEVIRFPYHNGDLKASGASQHIADLPTGGGHWTRAVEFSPDGKKMFVAVGSASNVDDTGYASRERKNRADILACDPANCELQGVCLRHSQCRRRDCGQSADRRIVVLGERARCAGRQPGAGLHHARGGRRILWLAVVVHRGASGSAAQGKHPELKDKAIVPDVLLQPHNASLEFTFYEGRQVSGGVSRETFSRRSMARGTRRCAWDMK